MSICTSGGGREDHIIANAQKENFNLTPAILENAGESDVGSVTSETWRLYVNLPNDGRYCYACSGLMCLLQSTTPDIINQMWHIPKVLKSLKSADLGLSSKDFWPLVIRRPHVLKDDEQHVFKNAMNNCETFIDAILRDQTNDVQQNFMFAIQGPDLRIGDQIFILQITASLMSSSDQSLLSYISTSLGLSVLTNLPDTLIIHINRDRAHSAFVPIIIPQEIDLATIDPQGLPSVPYRIAAVVTLSNYHYETYAHVGNDLVYYPNILPEQVEVLRSSFNTSIGRHDDNLKNNCTVIALQRIPVATANMLRQFSASAFMRPADFSAVEQTQSMKIAYPDIESAAVKVANASTDKITRRSNKAARDQIHEFLNDHEDYVAKSPNEIPPQSDTSSTSKTRKSAGKKQKTQPDLKKPKTKRRSKSVSKSGDTAKSSRIARAKSVPKKSKKTTAQSDDESEPEPQPVTKLCAVQDFSSGHVKDTIGLSKGTVYPTNSIRVKHEVDTPMIDVHGLPGLDPKLHGSLAINREGCSPSAQPILPDDPPDLMLLGALFLDRLSIAFQTIIDDEPGDEARLTAIRKALEIYVDDDADKLKKRSIVEICCSILQSIETSKKIPTVDEVRKIFTNIGVRFTSNDKDRSEALFGAEFFDKENYNWPERYKRISDIVDAIYAHRLTQIQVKAISSARRHPNEVPFTSTQPKKRVTKPKPQSDKGQSEPSAQPGPTSSSSVAATDPSQSAGEHVPSGENPTVSSNTGAEDQTPVEDATLKKRKQKKKMVEYDAIHTQFNKMIDSRDPLQTSDELLCQTFHDAYAKDMDIKQLKKWLRNRKSEVEQSPDAPPPPEVHSQIGGPQNGHFTPENDHALITVAIDLPCLEAGEIADFLNFVFKLHDLPPPCDKKAVKLRDLLGRKFTVAEIYAELQRFSFVVEDTLFCPPQRNNIAHILVRAIWADYIKRLLVEKFLFCFVDECGVYMNYCRSRRRTILGVVPLGVKSLHAKRTSVITCVIPGFGSLSEFFPDSGVGKEDYAAFISHAADAIHLYINSQPGKLIFFIQDNVPMHKSICVREVFRKKRIIPIQTVTYSPNCNEIAESFFSYEKCWLESQAYPAKLTVPEVMKAWDLRAMQYTPAVSANYYAHWLAILKSCYACEPALQHDCKAEGSGPKGERTQRDITDTVRKLRDFKVSKLIPNK